MSFTYCNVQDRSSATREVSWKVSLIRQKATGSSASLLYSVPTLNSIVETGNLLHVQFVQGTKHRWTSGLHEVLCEQQFENMMVFFTVACSNEPASYLLAWLMGWTWDNCEQIHAASNYSYIQDQHSNHLVTRPNKGLQNWLPAGRTKEVICRSGYKISLALFILKCHIPGNMQPWNAC